MQTKLFSKSLMLLLPMALIVTSASAQKYGKWTTPFSSDNVSKQYVDGKVIRTFKYHNPKLSKGSLGLAYGTMPITAKEWWTGPQMPTRTSVFEAFDESYTSCIGSLSLSANIMIAPWLELQLPITFSHSTGTLQSDRDNQGTFTEDWFAFTPNLKFIWAQNDLIQIYTRAGLGIAMINRYETLSDVTAVRAVPAFTWQVSPVGVEIGKRIKFFAEVGYGQTGVVTAGLKLHFNSLRFDGRGNARDVPEYFWYDSYITH